LDRPSFLVGDLSKFGAAKNHQHRQLEAVSALELAEAHWSWNFCNNAFFSQGDQCASNDIGSPPEGYQFITGRPFDGPCSEVTADNAPTVSCEVARGVSLVFPVGTYIYITFPEDEESLADVREIVFENFSSEANPAKVFAATLDGEPIHDIQYLVSDNFFNIQLGDTCPNTDVLFLDGYDSFQAGYWVILPPLAGGSHEILSVGGFDGGESCTSAVLYKIEVPCNIFCILGNLPLIGWIFTFLFGWLA